jgi:NDP-sugar pyrophosphorylase family protein
MAVSENVSTVEPKSVVALILAGGTGERMRASGVSVPKPLVPISGVPLIERNLRQLLRYGFKHIVVAVHAQGDEVSEFAAGWLSELAGREAARLEILVEQVPLGNIGCAGLLRGRDADILTIYADNLTSLDLSDILQRHRSTGAALTLAAHKEYFQMPYGRLTIEDGRIVAYQEKPQLATTVCSAIAVLGRRALALLPADRPTGLVDLATALIQAGQPVTAYEHDSLWIDVNDASAVARAERMVAEHPECFG